MNSGLRFQHKVAFATVISGFASVANFVFVAIFADYRCSDLGCDLSLAQDFGLLLVFGILLVGFGIVTALYARDPIKFNRRPRVDNGQKA
jgi:hypothetical protein